MSMYVPEDAQGHSSPQPAAPLQTHGGTGTNKKRNPLWSWRSIEQKVHDAREDSVNDAGAIEILRSEGVADPEAALATYAIQRPVRVDVPPYDQKRASYLAATRIRLAIKEGTLWEHSDITQALKKEDLWETLQDHYGLESWGLFNSYRWDRQVVEALERYIRDPRRVPADLAGPTSAKPLTADAAAAIKQREELARLRADQAELGEILTESFLGALSYGERLIFTDDPHDLLESARLGAAAEGVIFALGAAAENRGTYSPKVVDPAPIEPSGPVSPGGNPPTTPRPSELREKAEAGKRMLDRAEERLQKVVTDKAAGERLAAAEDALRRAQADIDTRQQAGKGPTKPQLSKLESARNKLAEAQTKQAAAIETARNKIDAARQLAATRAATYERAKADAAQRAAQPEPKLEPKPEPKPTAPPKIQPPKAETVKTEPAKTEPETQKPTVESEKEPSTRTDPGGKKDTGAEKTAAKPAAQPTVEELSSRMDQLGRDNQRLSDAAKANEPKLREAQSRYKDAEREADDLANEVIGYKALTREAVEKNPALKDQYSKAQKVRQRLRNAEKKRSTAGEELKTLNAQQGARYEQIRKNNAEAESLSRPELQLPPMQRGTANELRVLKEEGLLGIKPQLTVRDPKTGEWAVTIPDAVRLNGRTVDVKDVASLSETQQLRLQREYSRQRGQKPEIITGKKTKVAPDMEGNYDIRRRPDLGPR